MRIQINVLALADGPLRFTARTPNSLYQAMRGLRRFSDPLVQFDVQYIANIGQAPSNRKLFSATDLRDFDVLLLFGSTELLYSTSLSTDEVQAVTTSMDNGLGVFAVGDHNTMGKNLCGAIPRVPYMRVGWRDDDKGVAEGIGQPSRIETTVAREFDDASSGSETDRIGKAIWPRYYNASATDPETSMVHEVLATRGARAFAVRYLPDHEHEGRCSDDMDFKITEGFHGVPFETIAWSLVPAGRMGKQRALIKRPQLSPMLNVYDGHRVSSANIGRIAVDSTIHHWLDGNIESLRWNSRAVSDVRTYHSNVVRWLARKPLQERIREQAKAAGLADPQVIACVGCAGFVQTGAEFVRALSELTSFTVADAIAEEIAGKRFPQVAVAARFDPALYANSRARRKEGAVPDNIDRVRSEVTLDLVGEFVHEQLRGQQNKIDTKSMNSIAIDGAPALRSRLLRALADAQTEG